jgi:hypothetical protein
MTQRLETLPRFAALATLPRSAGSPARAIGDENAYHFAGSFRGTGSAREPGTHMYTGLGEMVQESVFMASGPGPRAVPE